VLVLPDDFTVTDELDVGLDGRGNLAAEYDERLQRKILTGERPIA
jgi:hypothetical protein